MKIAFIVNCFPVLSETFILNQVTGLIDRGHEVDIYADRLGDTTKVHPDVTKYCLLGRTYFLNAIPDNLFLRLIKGIKLYYINFIQDPIITLRSLNLFKYGSLAVSLRLLYTAIPGLNKSYDIVHCQFGTQGFRGMWFRAINSPNAKLITIFRGHDISQFVKDRGNKVYETLFQSGDFFLANCEFFRKKAVKLGCKSDEIIVHFSGLDVGKFAFKPRYLNPNDKIRVVTTGRLVEKKGIEYVIRAIAQLADHNPNLEYTIIGDGPLKEKFQQLIQTLNADSVVNLVGWKSEQEIIEILDQSHIFVAPSITAQDGDQDAPINVLKEAMAMGLPVVSTYHGGIPELVEDGISGFLVPERDTSALVKKLGYLAENPDCWSRMGQAGRTYVENYFDLNKLNDRLVDIYQYLLEPTTSPLEWRSTMTQSISNLG
jgi:colanic acid/amylovoran biosynthesis glycosyltransferase